MNSVTILFWGKFLSTFPVYLQCRAVYAMIFWDWSGSEFWEFLGDFSAWFGDSDEEGRVNRERAAVLIVEAAIIFGLFSGYFCRGSILPALAFLGVVGMIVVGAWLAHHFDLVYPHDCHYILDREGFPTGSGGIGQGSDPSGRGPDHARLPDSYTRVQCDGLHRRLLVRDPDSPAPRPPAHDDGPQLIGDGTTPTSSHCPREFNNHLYFECLHLLMKLHLLFERGQGESPEADVIRDRMDAPGESLSVAEKDSVAGLSEYLYSVAENPD